MHTLKNKVDGIKLLRFNHLGYLGWPPRVTLGRLLPHARGLGFKPRRGVFPLGAKNEWGLSPKAKVRVLHTVQLDVTRLAGGGPGGLGSTSGIRACALRNFNLEVKVLALMAFSDSESKVLFSEEVAVLKREVACKAYEINVLISEFKKVKQEKEGIKFKIKKFDNASKSLDKLIGGQIINNSKKGLGYHDVPPSHPLIYNGPTKLDLSYSGLDGFKEPKFKGYGPRDSKMESNINHDQKSDDSKENSDDSFVKQQVSEDISSFVESPLNVDKETALSVDKKIEFVKPKNYNKPVRKSVRYAKMYRSQPPRGNQGNWNGQKSNQLGSKPQNDDKGFIDSGCSRHMTGNIAYLSDLMEVMLHLGEEHMVSGIDRRTCYIKQKCVKSQSPKKFKKGRTLRYLSLVVPLIKVGDEAVHKEWGDRMKRAATTASSLEAEQNGVSTAMQILILLGKVNTAGLKETASASTLEDGKMKITATINGRIKTITEVSIRRHLKLEDSDYITTLPNVEIFEQLALMRASKGYNRVDIPLFPTMLVQGQIDQGVESTVPDESHHTPTNAPFTSQPPTLTPFMQTTHDVEEPATMPHDSPFPRVQSLGSVEGSLTLNELTVLCTKLSKMVEDLQYDLQQTKLTYGAAYTKLILRVKKLDHKVKTSQHRRRAIVVLSDDKEDLEDPSKQGRKIAEIDENPFISLPTELVEDFGSVEKGEKEISIVIPEVSSATENLVYIRRSAENRKDKGKAIMKEDKSVQKKDAEIAKQLQEAIVEADSSHDIDWNDPAVLRYHALQNRSFSVAEVRKNMCMYLKNQGGYKQSHFKGMRYEDIRLIFERVWDQIHAFVPMDSDIKKKVMKKSRFDLQQKQFAKEVSKKKDDSSSKPVGGKEEATAEYEKENEELRLSLNIIHNDDSEVNYEPLSKNFSIVSWEYQLLGKMEAKDMEVCKLTRADGSSSYHGNIQDFLRRLDRQDLNDLYSLVQERFQDHPLLRMIFDPDENDELWMNQLDWKLLRWKLHENCGVHTLFMDGALMEINMLVEKKYPLIKESLKKMLNL
nr:hypothetical protein [Tanacetum cinerariifolium]